MILSHLELTNVAQHRDLRVAFNRGVNAIVGKNGAGKSMLVKALQFAIIGDWPGDGTKESMITWGEKAGSVELAFSVHGRAGVVKRNLHSSAASLKYGTSDSWRKVADVNAQMAALLGTSLAVVKNYVFTHQGFTDRVLYETAAKRAELFSALFGTDRCEKLRDVLARELQDAVPVAALGNRDMLKTQLLALNQRIQDLKTRQDHIKWRVLSGNVEELQTRLVELKAAEAEYNHPVSGLGASLNTVKRCKQAEEKLEADLKVVEELLNQLTAERDMLEVVRAQHQACAKEAEVKAQQRVRRGHLISQLEARTRELESLKAPTEVADQDALIAKNEEALIPFVSQVSDAERFIRTVGTHGNCPTCLTTVIVDKDGVATPLTDRAKESQTTVDQFKPMIADIRNQIADYRSRRSQYLRDVQAYQVRQQQLQAAIEALKANLQDIPDVEPVDAAESHRVLARHSEIVQSIGKAQTERLKMQQTLANVKAEYAQAQQAVDRLSRITLTSYADLEAKLTQDSQARLELASLDGQIQEIEKSVVACNAQIQGLDRLEAQSGGITKYRTLLSSAIGVLHRDNYQAAVARRHFAAISSSWNKILGYLDQPYTVGIGEDQAIRLQFPDQLTYFSSASGGQQCCAAIAFLLAVNMRFAAQAGILVLDEPTNGVDAHHIPMIAQLFASLHAMAVNSELQVILVTHDERLLTGIENVIRI